MEAMAVWAVSAPSARGPSSISAPPMARCFGSSLASIAGTWPVATGGSEQLPEQGRLLVALCAGVVAFGAASQRELRQQRCRVVCKARGGQTAQATVLTTRAPLASLDELKARFPVGEQQAPPKRERARVPSQATLDEVHRLLEGKLSADEISGVPTGWKELDKLYKPVRGEFTVVTGIPGSGKSEWLLSLLLNLSELHGWRNAVCAFEHKHEDLALQMLEKKHRCHYRMLPANLHKSEQFLKQHVLPIGSFSQELDIDDVIAAAQYYADVNRSSGGLHGLMIDPYNYITRPSNISETDFVSGMLTKVKQFAVQNHVHVWLVVHPVKQGKWKNAEKPNLYDCSGSAHFFNKCDMGIIVHRSRAIEDAQYGAVMLSVEKVRNKEAGEVGATTLYFDRSSREFSEQKPETPIVDDSDEEQ